MTKTPPDPNAGRTLTLWRGRHPGQALPVLERLAPVQRAEPALTAVGSGHSFTHSLTQIPFIPASLISELEVGEVSGTLDKKLHWFAGQMRQLIDAKLEPIRALAIAIVINVGLIPILAAVLPWIFPQYPMIAMALAVFGGYATLACARYGFSQYMTKSSGVNIWWN